MCVCVCNLEEILGKIPNSLGLFPSPVWHPLTPGISRSRVYLANRVPGLMATAGSKLHVKLFVKRPLSVVCTGRCVRLACWYAYVRTYTYVRTTGV